MEELLNEILQELKAIHSRLDSIDSSIAIYSSDGATSEILEVLKQIKQAD